MKRYTLLIAFTYIFICCNNKPISTIFKNSHKTNAFEDCMTPAFYRNLEKDNTLSLADYYGRQKPIQSPILCVETSSNFIILKNVPYIEHMVNTPKNWGLHNMTRDFHPDNNLINFDSVTYIGTYKGSENCCKFYTTQRNNSVGNDIFSIYNIFPKGIWRNTEKIVKRSTGYWNFSYVASAAAMWKNQDKSFSMLVAGINDRGHPTYVKHHIFKSNTLLGEWTDQNTEKEDLFNSSALPIGYIGISPINGNIETKEGKFAGATVLWASRNGEPASTRKLAIAIWDENLKYREVVPLKIEQKLEIEFEAWGWVSLTYHRGKYLYSVQNGTSSTGKRVVLQSETLTGPYFYHSTIIDFTTLPKNRNNGNMWQSSFANGSLLSLKGNLYFFSSGDRRDTNRAGAYFNHYAYLWKYDNQTDTWNEVKNAFPLLTSPHSDTHYGFNWGADHLGYISGFYKEKNKLWFCYSMTSGTNTYELTNGYIDFSELCD